MSEWTHISSTYRFIVRCISIALWAIFNSSEDYLNIKIIVKDARVSRRLGHYCLEIRVKDHVGRGGPPWARATWTWWAAVGTCCHPPRLWHNKDRLEVSRSLTHFGIELRARSYTFNRKESNLSLIERYSVLGLRLSGLTCWILCLKPMKISVLWFIWPTTRCFFLTHLTPARGSTLDVRVWRLKAVLGPSPAL